MTAAADMPNEKGITKIRKVAKSTPNHKYNNTQWADNICYNNWVKGKKQHYRL